jgi:hypothetical protein
VKFREPMWPFPPPEPQAAPKAEPVEGCRRCGEPMHEDRQFCEVCREFKYQPIDWSEEP